MSKGPDRHLLEHFLQEQGHRTLMLSEDVQGTALSSLDLVLVDEACARRDEGWLRQLKGRRHLLPVLMTLREYSRTAAGLLAQGIVDDALRMPVSKSELKSRLRLLFRLGQQSRLALNKYERLFEDASCGITVLHPHTLEIQAANIAFAEMHGYSPRDIVARAFGRLVVPDHHIQLQQHLARLSETGYARFELKHIHRDGRTFPAEVDAALYPDSAGTPLYIAAYVRDITDRRQAEVELNRRNRDLERAVAELENTSEKLQEAIRIRDEFLSIASHELKTPLTPMLIQLHTLLAQVDPVVAGEHSAEWLSSRFKLLEKQALRLDRLINDLLDVSRISGKSPSLRPQPTDLGQLAKEVVARFEETGEQMGTPLQLALESGVVGWWDPLRVDQIITNLLSNALKFGERRPIVIGVAREKNCATLRVRDQGRGIAPEDQARIFAKFERAVPERQFGGFGLGLWIVRHLVQAMGGTISVSSELGQGSTFTVRLPSTLP